MSNLSIWMILSLISFGCLLSLYFFRIGIELKRSKGWIFLWNAVFGWLFNLALIFLLYAYGFFVNLRHCLLFCNATGDSNWRNTWLYIVICVAFAFSFVFLLLQGKLARKSVLVRADGHYLSGPLIFTGVHAVVWWAIAEFKLLPIFQSYHGPA